MAKVKTVTKVGAAHVSKVAASREKIVREKLAEVKDGIETGYLDLSELLSEAYHKEFHLVWGFETFEKYCQAELDMAYRRAMYLVDIWDKVKSLDLPRTRVAKLGWSKMKEVAAVVTKKNAEALLKKAENMTVKELKEHTRTMRRTDFGGKGGTRGPETKAWSFRLGESESKVVEDAITEAKKMMETDSVGVAIEGICSEWLTYKGGHPEAAALEDFISYLERMYPVKISFKAAPKKKSNGKGEEASEVLEEVEGKKSEKGKKGKKAKAAKKEEPEESNEESSEEDELDVTKILGIEEE